MPSKGGSGSQYSNLCQIDPKTCRRSEIAGLYWNKDTAELELRRPKSSTNAKNSSFEAIRSNLNLILPNLLEQSFGGRPPREIKKAIRVENAKALPKPTEAQALARQAIKRRSRPGQMPDCLRAYARLSKDQKRAHLAMKRQVKKANQANGAIKRMRAGGRQGAMLYRKTAGPCMGGGAFRPGVVPRSEATGLRRFRF